MRRGTIFLIIFIVVSLGIVGASIFIKNQPPITITVAVDPLGEAWLRQAVTDFNNSETQILNGTRRVQVNVQVISELEVWRPTNRDTAWTAQNHPTAWIPSSSISLAYATSQPFEVIQPSVAKTLLVFAGYQSRVDVLTNNGAEPLTWEHIIRAAQTESWQALGGDPSWRFVNLAFSLPDRKMCGLGTLLSAAASLSDSPNLTSSALRGTFTTEFAAVVQSVPNFNSIGNDVAAYMARGGPATVDFAIAPESLWLNNLSGLVANEPVRFSYPDYAFVFDFPLAIWQDQHTTSEQRQAAQAFGTWLMGETPQNSALRYGLRPASGVVPPSAELFFEAQQYGIQLDVSLDDHIQPPGQADTQGLLTWFQTARN